MAESEILGTILHMARVTVLLDVAQICAWVGAVLNVGVLTAAVVKDIRRGKAVRHGK